MTTSDLLSDIASAAPSLSAWCKEMSSDPDLSIRELLTHLRFELTRDKGRMVELPQLAPVIERLLIEADEEDQVSLGLIEPLVWDALDGTLNAAETRTALGPTGRSVWDDLYLGPRRDDLRAVQFEEGDLGPVATIPARLVQWLLTPNQWVNAGTPVAQMAVDDRAAVLQVKVRCWIDRFATPPGHTLQTGDLLLYVAPESPTTPKGEPLCALVVEPAA